MIGFVIGTLCLVGLFRVLRRGYLFGHHHRAFGSCGPGYGGGFGGFGPSRHGGGYRDPWSDYGAEADADADPWERDRDRGPRSWGGHGQRAFLRGLFQRLDTTPGQEKVILSVVDELKTASKNVRDEMRGARSEIAGAMRSESFDEVALGGATARVEHGIDTMRRAGIDAFAKIHEVLDERQRKQLADWLERGPRGFGF